MGNTGTDHRPIGDLASTSVISVEPTAPLRVVVQHFVERGVSFVVVSDAGSVAGVVSEHDVLRAIHDGADIDEIWAADIMTTDLVTTDRQTPVVEAARLMTANQVRHLIVVGPEWGVVSIRDVLEALVA